MDRGYDTEKHPIKEVDPERCIEKLKKVGQVRAYAKGDVLAEPGRADLPAFIVLEGAVVAQYNTPSGEENVYITHEPGFALLEAQCFCEWSETAYFRATEPTRALAIERKALMRAVAEDPELALFFIGTLSMKFRWYIEHARHLSAYCAMWRLCDLLIHHAQTHGAPQEDGTVLITKKLSQQLIGNMLHINRITVVRNFKELKEMGLVETDGGNVRIFDLPRLIEYRNQFS